MTPQPSFDLSGRTAVVTGVAGGIGDSIANALRGAGATVVGTDVQPADKAPEGLDHYLQCDLSDVDAIFKLADEVNNEVGPVHILVNAGAIAREGKAEIHKAADWDAVLDVNARGTFYACQAFGKGMIERKYGKIINFSSRCGYIGYSDYISYNASKAAVNSITWTLAVEWAPHNITVNALAPGFVKTPMTEYVWSNPERLAAITSRCPMGRMAEPHEIGGAIVFFASPASDYITGTVLPFDGGMLIY
jgi:2-deoxy-D-gluconate 3-dehydrogenase